MHTNYTKFFFDKRYLFLLTFIIFFIPHLIFYQKYKEIQRYHVVATLKKEPTTFYFVLKNNIIYHEAQLRLLQKKMQGLRIPKDIYKRIFFGLSGINRRVVRSFKLIRINSTDTLFKITLFSKDPKKFESFLKQLNLPLVEFGEVVSVSENEKFKSDFIEIENNFLKFSSHNDQVQSLIQKYHSSLSHYYKSSSFGIRLSFFKGMDESHILKKIYQLNKLVVFLNLSVQSRELRLIQSSLESYMNQIKRTQEAFFKTKQILLPYIWYAFKKDEPYYFWLEENRENVFNFKRITSEQGRRLIPPPPRRIKKSLSYFHFLKTMQLPVLIVFFLLVLFVYSKRKKNN